LNVEELEAAFRQMVLHSLNTDQGKRGACAVSIDGKVQKGRLKFEEENSYPIHAVSLVDHQTGIVLTQGHVEKTDVESKSKGPGEQEQEEQEEQEAQKQQSELAVASRLMQHIDWKGKVLTGDALYCQRGLCSALRASRRGLAVSGEGKSASIVGRCARAGRLHSLLQNEQGKGSCDYLSNTLTQGRRRMGVWTSAVFGCLQNSKAIPIGLT
jgi:hypothetical protein